MIELIERFLLEYLVQEHLAERRRELVYQSADAEVLIRHDILFRVEHLADLKRYLRFLERSCKILDAVGGGADTDRDFGIEFGTS